MAEISVNVMIGGAAGQGLATVGQLLAKSLVRSGYEIVVRQDYMSRVRGGHNTFIIRASDGDIRAPREDMDLLVALNQETVDLHKDELAAGGLVFLDDELDAGDLPALSIPFKDLAPKPIFQNVAALGVLASALGLDPEVPKRSWPRPSPKRARTSWPRTTPCSTRPTSGWASRTWISSPWTRPPSAGRA